MKRSALLLCIDIAQREHRKQTTPARAFRHWSFVWQHNRLLEWAVNRPESVGFARRFGYYDYRHTLHAEVAALKKSLGLLDRRKPWYMVNVRLLANGALGCSKPCLRCQGLLHALGCAQCWYTTGAYDPAFCAVKF